MSVPESIRKVPRPKNTIVADNGREGPYRWAVRERSGVKYKTGLKNPQPQTGKVIGHIVNGKYVPKDNTKDLGIKGTAKKAVACEITEEKSCLQEENKKGDEKVGSLAEPSFLEYGASAFVHSFVQDIENDLLEVFGQETTFQLLSAALLRVLDPEISDSQLQFHYNTCFISQFYPETALSSKEVHKLEYRLGVDEKSRRAFAERRYSKIPADHHVAISRMRKQDNRTDNSLNGFADKPRGQECGGISLYAYDVETKEPVCSEIAPSSWIDASTYARFIRDHTITQGILVEEKGFPPAYLESMLKECPGVHFLTPIPDKDQRVTTYGVHRYHTSISVNGRNILCHKVKLPDGYFLYAYRDIQKAYEAEYAFSKKIITEGGSFDPALYASSLPAFGSLVLESDLDMQPETAYAAFEERRQVEEIFRLYHTPVDLDINDKQSDFMIVGSALINLLSALVTSRIYQFIEQTGKLDCCTYPDIMAVLQTAWRRVDAPPPVTGDIYWVHLFQEAAWVMEQLGISRPGTAWNLTIPADLAAGLNGDNNFLPEVPPEDKRNPGGAPREEPAAKRGPGRPRVHPPKDPNEPKRPVGRPRIHPPKDLNEPKRRRGRPRKTPQPEV